MKKILLALLPLALFGSNLSEIANKATQNEISKIKELELKRANLSDEATSSAYLPSLSLEGSYGKNASTFPSIVAKESAGVLARIDFLLYDGGAREARLKMSQLLKNKAAIASDEAKNYLAFKAVNLYFNACALENIIAAKKAQANFLKGVLDKLEKANIPTIAIPKTSKISSGLLIQTIPFESSGSLVFMLSISISLLLKKKANGKIAVLRS